MLDPFPPPPAWVRRFIEPYALRFNSPTLPEHIHEILLAFSVYQFIHYVLSPWLSPIFFSKYYPHFNRRTKINWDVHVVSLFQSILINSAALWIMFVDKERKSMSTGERVFGYTGACGMIQALAVAYFLYDLIISLVYVRVFGIGLLFHAVSALWVFSLGFVSHPLPVTLTTSSKRRPFLILGFCGLETVCQLLRSSLRPLRALNPILEYPLVPRQSQHDRQPRTMVQRHAITLRLLLLPSSMGNLAISSGIPGHVERSTANMVRLLSIITTFGACQYKCPSLPPTRGQIVSRRNLRTR